MSSVAVTLAMYPSTVRTLFEGHTPPTQTPISGATPPEPESRLQLSRSCLVIDHTIGSRCIFLFEDRGG